MTLGEKIQWLSDNCKASLTIEVNGHRDYYESVKDKMSDKEIERDVLDKMIQLNRIVWVQAYPLTPIGFYVCYHWDLETAVNDVYESVKEELKSQTS